MKEADLARITRALENIDTWRASGMKLSAYAQSRGEALSYWRAPLSWDRRWRQMLNGTYTRTPVAFVQAIPSQASSAVQGKRQTPQHSAQPRTSACITINVQGTALQVSVQWPLEGKPPVPPPGGGNWFIDLGQPAVASNSSMRLLGCVGKRISTSVR